MAGGGYIVVIRFVRRSDFRHFGWTCQLDDLPAFPQRKRLPMRFRCKPGEFDHVAFFEKFPDDPGFFVADLARVQCCQQLGGRVFHRGYPVTPGQVSAQDFRQRGIVGFHASLGQPLLQGQ